MFSRLVLNCCRKWLIYNQKPSTLNSQLYQMSFPTNFTWGVAAASYQIEGASNKDGKGLSVWDMLTRQPGKIWEGHTGDMACDRYHRYQEDINSMREIGVNAYRLSISWPRVIPAGAGAVNNKGLGQVNRRAAREGNRTMDHALSLGLPL